MTANYSKNEKASHPLTVMQVIPSLKVGGVERGTVEFSIYLKQQGHRPVVVSQGGPLVKDLAAHEIEHVVMNVGKKSLSTLFYVKKLRRLMVQLDVDVVHARSRIPAWLCYLGIKRLSKKPKFVTTLHGLHSVNRYSAIMAKGDQVIAVSQTAKDYLTANFKSSLNQQPLVIYRGIDPQFKFNHQPCNQWLDAVDFKYPEFRKFKKILLPGRLSQLKGVEHLVAWLAQSSDMCRLVLTASPEESNYSQRIKHLLAEKGLLDKVIWLGVIRNMPDLYAAVDVVVSASNKPESFGRTVLEALSIGTPVVAFNQGGVSEVMNQLFPEGLVTAGDEALLTERINLFLKQKPDVRPHNLFTNQEMFEKTLSLYHQLTGIPE